MYQASKFILNLTITLVALTFVFLMTSCSSQKKTDEEILAKVGQFDITKQHYLNELRRFYDRTGQAVNLGSDVMENVLNSRVNRYAIVEFAFDKGWDAEPESQHMKSMIERKVLMEEFERKIIHANVQISEKELRELFYRANTSIRASHLVARSRHEADSLFALLESGHTFETLAKDIFRNSELAQSGGDLGYFTVDDMDISFEDTAYRMEIGDISEPVKTNHGYSIIKLTDIVETPIVTETEFANKKQEVASIATNQQHELATRKHMRETIDAFETNHELISILWKAVQENPEAYYSFEAESNMISLNIPEENLDNPIVQTDDFTFTVRDFLKEAYFSSKNQRSLARSIHSFTEQVHGTAYRVKAMNTITSHPDFEEQYVQRTIEETFFNFLHERFEAYLDDLIDIPNDMIRMEYTKNREMYVEPLQLNMAEITVTSQERADQVWELLQQGRDFNAVLRQYSADPSAREHNGELGFIPIDRFGMMAPSLGSIQPGEYAGPFQLMSNRFVVFKCLDRIEPTQLTLEEAEPLVRKNLHNYYKDELRSIKIQEARNQFNATIFTERLHAIPIQL